MGKRMDLSAVTLEFAHPIYDQLAREVEAASANTELIPLVEAEVEPDYSYAEVGYVGTRRNSGSSHHVLVFVALVVAYTSVVVGFVLAAS